MDKNFTHLIEEITKTNTRIESALTGLNTTITSLNHDNVLHQQNMKTAIDNNTRAIRFMDSHISKIMFFLVIALAILAGAEKILSIIK